MSRASASRAKIRKLAEQDKIRREQRMDLERRILAQKLIMAQRDSLVEVDHRLDADSGSCAVTKDARVTRRNDDLRRMSRNVDTDVLFESFDDDLVVPDHVRKIHSRKIIADTEPTRTRWS